MILDEKTIEKKAEQALRTSLGGVPFLKITEFKKKSSQTNRRDFIFRVSSPDYQKMFVAEVGNSGQPKAVREAVNQLLRYRESMPQAGFIFVAPYVSNEAAKICEQDGVSYMDLAGNCLVSFGGVFIKNQGNPNPFTEKRELRSLYSPKASRILRVLLAKPKAGWKAIELSKEARVSQGQVSNVRKLLEAKEWAITDKGGLKLISPDALLKEWQSHYDYRQNQSCECYTIQNIEEFEKMAGAILKKKKIPYAFTGFTAAERMAPMVRYKRIMLFMPQPYQEEAIQCLELKEVEDGANISVLAPYDDGVFYGMKEVDGVQIVSPIQAYLDLSKYRGRGEEAAQKIFEKEILPLW